jgi:GntR family transcriptional regulator, trigonelline degradation regulator
MAMKAEIAEPPRSNGRSKGARPGNGSVRKGKRVSARKNGKGKSQDRRIKDRLLRVDLSRQLCALITDGTYRPGDHMTERELCDRLKASRPSIRETLRQLEAEGLVDIYPNRGAVVRKLSRDTFLQLWEVRQALETLAAERFARGGQPEQIERFGAAIRRMDEALRSRDRKKIKTSKAEMFEAFVAGANSELLSAYVRQINVRLSFLWSSSLLVEGRPAESIIELSVLLNAIKASNPDAARAAVLLYNEHSKAMAMHALKSLEEQEKT